MSLHLHHHKHNVKVDVDANVTCKQGLISRTLQPFTGTRNTRQGTASYEIDDQSNHVQ